MKLLRKIFGIKTKEEKQQLQKEWEEMKIGLREKVSGLTQPAVHLLKTDRKTNSWFGGRPMVNESDFIWPRSNENPMCFLAQIDLNEINQEHEYEWLGKSGSVLFFYEVMEMPWGFDPKDRGKWKVIYQESPTITMEYPNDLEQECKISERYIEASKVQLLPSWEDEIIEDLNLSDEETDLFIEIEEHYKEFDAFGDSPAHQVGGFPRPVQGDIMQFESEQASKGVYMGDSKGYKSASKKDFEEAKNKWQLLFQFDSDDELDVMWGDVGMVYFWVETDKSKKNNFEDSWLVLQCH